MRCRKKEEGKRKYERGSEKRKEDMKSERRRNQKRRRKYEDGKGSRHFTRSWRPRLCTSFLSLVASCWSRRNSLHGKDNKRQTTEMNLCRSHSPLMPARHKTHSSYLSRPSFRSWSFSFRVSLSLCSISDSCRSSCMLSASSRSLTCEWLPGGRWERSAYQVRHLTGSSSPWN